MKRVQFFLLILLPILGWSQSLDSVVDFDLELSSLADPTVSAAAAAEGKIVILEGLMADTVIDYTSDDVRVWVSLIGGSWIGTEEVRSYSCRILFRGESWIEAFPGSLPPDPSPSYVPQGSRLLVAARVIGYDTEQNTPLAEMVDFRILN